MGSHEHEESMGYDRDDRLTMLLHEIVDLPLSERYQKLAIFVRSREADPQLRQEFEECLASSQMTTRDFAVALRASKSTSWAVNLLLTSPYQNILTAAVDSIGSQWRVDPSLVKGLLDGDDGLVRLMNTLPHFVVIRLFRLLSRTGPLLPIHVATVDHVLRAIYPFLSDGSPTPLARYARSAMMGLFMAASPSVAIAVVGRCAAWLDESRWAKFASRRPELVAEILLRQIGVVNDINLLLEQPWRLAPTLGVIIRKQADSTFFTQFLNQYVKYVLQDPATRDNDVLGANRSTRLRILATHISCILRKRTKAGTLEKAFEFCDTLTILTNGGACGEWTCGAIDPLLRIAWGWFNESPELWSSKTAENVVKTDSGTTDRSVAGLLSVIFAQLAYSNDSLSIPDLILVELLKNSPIPARLPLLDLLHKSKTGESLYSTPTTPTSYPKICAYILSLLRPADGRLVLDIGTKSRSEEFIVDPYRRHGSRSADKERQFRNLWLFLKDADAAPAALPAVWAGARRSVIRDTNLLQNDPDEACVREIQACKGRAMRSRDNRYTYVIAALTICVLGRSPSLFSETLSWAVTRYAKDPDTSPSLLAWLSRRDENAIPSFIAGPVGLFASHRTRGKLSRNFLTAYCGETSKIFASLMHLLRVWALEPNMTSGLGGHYSFWQSHEYVANVLFDVIKRRIDLVDRVYPVLCDDLDYLQGVLLTPMVAIWIEWERFKVIDHPALLLKTNQTTPYMISQLTVPDRILPVVLRFVDQLGEAREKLYHELRVNSSELRGPDIHSRLKRLADDALSPNKRRHFLPFDLDVWGKGTNKGNVSGHFESYLNSILFDDLRKTFRDLEDKLDWHPVQISAALETYLKLSKDKKDVSQKIQKLLRHYSSSDPDNDYRLVILRSDTVQRYLWKDETINREVCSWLPEYPPMPESGEVEFDPIVHMPPTLLPSLDKDQQDSTPVVLLRAYEEMKDDIRISILLSSFRPDHYPSVRGASIHTARKLLVFVTAWLLTILGVKRDVDIGPTSAGPITYAIRKVRISQKFLDSYNDTSVGGHSFVGASNFPCEILATVLHLMSPSEIAILLRAVSSAENTSLNLALSMAVFRTVRRMVPPSIILSHAFPILEDVEKSSWHRQIITNGLFNWRRPSEAQELMDLLLTFNRDKYEAQKVKKTLIIKTSTQKMILQVFAACVKHGSIGVNYVEKISASGILTVPPTIVSYVVVIFVEAIVVSSTIARNKPDRLSRGPLALLDPYIEAAQRLTEDIHVSEEDWASARAGTASMPSIVEERPIAASLLGVNTGEMPVWLTETWAAHVVEPILIGHLCTRTRWLETAAAREGASGAAPIASFGSGMPFVHAFHPSRFGLRFTYAGTTEALLRAVEQRALAFQQRVPARGLRDVMGRMHPPNWEREPYGKALTDLTAYAISDSHRAECLALDAIRCIYGVARVDGLEGILERLTLSFDRVGKSLLKPTNMLQTNSPSTYVAPFGLFEHFITAHLKPEGNLYWETWIRPLLTRFLAIAEECERVESSEMLHGGACYWRVILVLKLMLLPDMTNADPAKITAYSQALLAIISPVAEGYSRGWHHVHFPEDFTSLLKCQGRRLRVEHIVPICRALTSTPICPRQAGMLRVLCLETALALLRTNKGAINGSVGVRQELHELLDVWRKDEDGATRLLALRWEDRDAQPEPVVNDGWCSPKLYDPLFD